jgi:hypothetical protein
VLPLNYECICDTAAVGIPDVIAALALVEGIYKGVSHPEYAYATCTNVTAKRWKDDPFRWDVSATFKEPRPQPGSPTNPSDPTSPGGQPTPPSREPYVSGHFADEMQFPGFDLDGKAVVNSAGDPFDNPPGIPATIGVFTVTKYFDSIDYFVLSGYKNATNNAPWNSFPTHSLRISNVAWAPHSERGWNGWKVTFEVMDRAVTEEQLAADPTATGGWHPLPVLDVGWYALVDVNPDPDIEDLKKVIIDQPPGSGVPRNAPCFLDAEFGFRSDTPHYLPFRIYNEISFAILDP